MRFIWGAIPPSEQFETANVNWNRLHSPPVEFAVLQVLFGMTPCLLAGGLALQRAAEGIPPISFLIILLMPAVLVPVHELAHVLGYFIDPRSPRLLTGIWPSHGIWYVIYDGPLPRWRVLAMLVAPFATLSIPLGVAALIAGGPYGWGLGYLSLLHTALCIGDFSSFCRIAWQVPRGGYVQNNGWTTYWSTSKPLMLAPVGSPPRTNMSDD